MLRTIRKYAYGLVPGVVGKDLYEVVENEATLRSVDPAHPRDVPPLEKALFGTTEEQGQYRLGKRAPLTCIGVDFVIASGYAWAAYWHGQGNDESMLCAAVATPALRCYMHRAFSLILDDQNRRLSAKKRASP